MRTLVVFSVMSLALGCKGKPKVDTQQPPPANVETPEGAKPEAPRDVDLPQGPGTPPVKTTHPIDAEHIQKMAALKFEGFVQDIRDQKDDKSHLWVLQQIPTHPVLRASIHVDVCSKDAPCWNMDLATWKSHEEELKGYLTPELRAAPDTKFEIGELEFRGVKMIYTYQLAQVVGGGHSAFSEAYVLYYNDGVNTIRVLSEYKDDLLKSKEEMARVLPRTDLENVSKAFVDVYTHAWQ